MFNGKERLIRYMQSHPKWHYALDLSRACKVNRLMLYIHLETLEERGEIDTKVEDVPSHPGLQPRTMYRARFMR